jgi:hypothetical protein
MKKLLLILAFMSLTSIVFAGTTSTKLGNTTYYSGDNSGSSNTIGSTTYYTVNGQSGTANTIGGTTYYNGALFNGRRDRPEGIY